MGTGVPTDYMYVCPTKSNLTKAKLNINDWCLNIVTNKQILLNYLFGFVGNWTHLLLIRIWCIILIVDANFVGPNLHLCYSNHSFHLWRWWNRWKRWFSVNGGDTYWLNEESNKLVTKVTQGRNNLHKHYSSNKSHNTA